MAIVLSTVAVLIAIAAPVLGGPFNDLNAFGYDPVANAGAFVNSGNARFTVLTPWVIRMEYSSNGFEDRATLMAVNRKLPVPSFTTSTSNGWLKIVTNAVTLRYRVGQGFSAQTLQVTTTAGANWAFGTPDYGNLLGTIKSLDELCTISLNCTINAGTIIHDEELHCAWGVVSRNGWTVVDDTHNFIMSAQHGEWFSNSLRSVSDVDQYFFGHGTNFRQALADYTAIAGKTPMQRVSLLGAWYTRWFDFDNGDIERLIDIFKRTSLPLDVLILDMNWHTKNDWTGYTWDNQLYPESADTLNFIHSHGLVTAGNVHDADGVSVWEQTYAEMCAVMGIDPASNQAVQFAPLNGTYMRALDDITCAATGFDYFWIDWQQGGQAGGCSGGRMNPTFITDHVRGTFHMRRKEDMRDHILARWGGMGNHRYPVGFSGDVSSLTWQCFAFQPYFSVTAANVAYSFISHDLVGPAHDHELHVRWMQFGAYSGVMRIHDRGMSAGSCWPTCPIVNIWLLPWQYFEPIREVMTARVALLPYMYTETRKSFDSGVNMVHPMYYDWPTESNAYLMGPDGVHAQYMFGDEMIVAPITFAADSNTMLASKEIWLPPGLWWDDVFGRLINGSIVHGQQYSLQEVPVFVRAGAIIPRIRNPTEIGVASRGFRMLDVYVYPGSSNNSYAMYEDDGVTLQYLSGSYAFTNINYVRTGNAIRVKVAAMSQSFNGSLATRALRIILVGATPATSNGVMADGVQIPYTRFEGQAGSWSYSGKTGNLIIDLGSKSTSSDVNLKVTFALPTKLTETARIKGYFERMRLAKRTLDDVRETPYSTTVGAGLTKLAASRGVQLSYLSGIHINQFSEAVQSYQTLVAEALAEMGGNPSPTSPGQQYVLTQMWNPTRKDMLLCGTPNCIGINSDYQIMWTEGYQVLSNDPNAIQLFDYYSSQYTDNWADTTTSTPGGYSPAIFTNGYVSSSSTTGNCLQVWYNQQTNDHMTLSTQMGRDWATSHGYDMIESCIGYVSATAPVSEELKLRDLKDAAFTQATALVSSVLPSS